MGFVLRPICVFAEQNMLESKSDTSLGAAWQCLAVVGENAHSKLLIRLI